MKTVFCPARFLVRNSIDERVFELQQKKLEISKLVSKPQTAEEGRLQRAQDILGLLV